MVDWWIRKYQELNNMNFFEPMYYTYYYIWNGTNSNDVKPINCPIIEYPHYWYEIYQ